MVWAEAEVTVLFTTRVCVDGRRYEAGETQRFLESDAQRLERAGVPCQRLSAPPVDRMWRRGVRK